MGLPITYWHCSTQWHWGAQSSGRVWLCHIVPSIFSSSPSLSCLCHHPFLTSDVDLDFPAVLAPRCGDPALPETRVCLRQVLHLKLAGDLPWLDDGFDELQVQKVPSAPRLSPLVRHTNLKLPSSPVGRQVLLREPAIRGWWWGKGRGVVP